jgi:hypothetical protein
MNPTNNSETSTSGSDGLDLEDLAIALLDYADSDKKHLNDKYRCRDCGQLYNTMEAHDHHQRKAHNHATKYLLEELPM